MIDPLPSRFAASALESSAELAAALVTELRALGDEAGVELAGPRG